MANDPFCLGVDLQTGRQMWMRSEDRRHCYVAGQTGAGKSKMLVDWAMQDYVSGHGATVVDPKGDLIADLLRAIVQMPESEWPAAAASTVIVDPADDDWVVGFNPLQRITGASPTRQRLELLSAFHKAWGIDATKAPRMEILLRRTLQVLIDQGRTLLDTQRFLVDGDFRSKLVEQCEEEDVRLFWSKEFPASESLRQQWCSPLLSRVEALLDDPNIRAMFAQPGCIDFRKAMDRRHFTLVSLAKGRVGEETSRLLGGLMMTHLQLAGESRVDIWPPENRLPHYLYIDEFQNYQANRGINELLGESRGYGLRLIMAHQNASQLNDELRATILGNSQIRVCFRVSYDDSLTMARELFHVTGTRIKETKWEPVRLSRKLSIPLPQPVYYTASEEMRKNVEELHELPDRVAWLSIGGAGITTRLYTNTVPNLGGPGVEEKVRRFKELSATLGGYAVRRSEAMKMIERPDRRALPPPARAKYEYEGWEAQPEQSLETER
jgi:hypothetical protein